MRLCIYFLLNKLSGDSAASLSPACSSDALILPQRSLQLCAPVPLHTYFGAIVGSEWTPKCIDADAVNNYCNRKRLFELSCWFNLSLNFDFHQHSRAETGLIFFFEIKEIIIAAGKAIERFKKKTLCIINKLFNKHL